MSDANSKEFISDLETFIANSNESRDLEKALAKSNELSDLEKALANSNESSDLEKALAKSMNDMKKEEEELALMTALSLSMKETSPPKNKLLNAYADFSRSKNTKGDIDVKNILSAYTEEEIAKAKAKLDKAGDSS